MIYNLLFLKTGAKLRKNKRKTKEFYSFFFKRTNFAETAESYYLS